MKFVMTDLQIIKSLGKAGMILPVPLEMLEEVQKVEAGLEAKKKYIIEIKRSHDIRRLELNSAMWLLLSEMSQKLTTSKDELYLTMLERYGVYEVVYIIPKALPSLKKLWKLTSEFGTTTDDGKTLLEVHCYKGSSKYDTAEFLKLLSGIVSEAEEMDIKLIPRSSLALLNDSSEGKKYDPQDKADKT